MHLYLLRYFIMHTSMSSILIYLFINVVTTLARAW